MEKQNNLEDKVTKLKLEAEQINNDNFELIQELDVQKNNQTVSF